MANSEEPYRLKRALERHSIEAVSFLSLMKDELGDSGYGELVKVVQEIAKRSANPDGGITAEQCKEIFLEFFVGRSTRLLNCFRHFVQGRDPFHGEPQPPCDPVSFLMKLQASIPDKDYNDFLTVICQFWVEKTIPDEKLHEEVNRIMGHNPQLMEIFQTYLPARPSGALPTEQPCGSPTPSPTGEAVLSFTPDVDAIRMQATNISNNVAQLEYPRDQNHKGIEYKGDGESLYAAENEGDKIDPLPDWSPSRENELPPKVDLSICAPCTTNYRRLPEDCLTLRSSYWTQLGCSVLNDITVSVASGAEDCYKFRTKSEYEEIIIKQEDDMFESDMLLQRFIATADLIGNLQDRVDSDMKILEHLTPLHLRCIEMLYEDYGLDIVDHLSETQNTTATLAILHSRLNQKIEDLSVSRVFLHRRCSKIIANNYNRSLDYRSSSFKQLDAKRMTPKEMQRKAAYKKPKVVGSFASGSYVHQAAVLTLLSEAKEINMNRLIDGARYLPSRNNQHYLIADYDLHIQQDIDSIVSYASQEKISSGQKPVTLWTKLVQPFICASRQLSELNCTVCPKEVCDRCGLSQKTVNSILSDLFAKNFPLSSKTGEYHGIASKKSTSVLGNNEEIEEGEFIPCKENILGPANGTASSEYNGNDSNKPTSALGSNEEIEEGEFIPYKENIQRDTMLEPANGTASYDVASLSGDGPRFWHQESSICNYDNKDEVQHQSREGSKVEMGSLAYANRGSELRDVKGTKTCCSLAVLSRLHQILYERLLVAKGLSREESTKALSRGSGTCDLYARFKRELFKLLNGSTNSSRFEDFCLNRLGPKPYVLITLDKLIWQVINQLRGVCDKYDLLIQLHEKTKSRSSPGGPSNGSLLEQVPEQGGKGSKVHDGTVEPIRKHYQRRKKTEAREQSSELMAL